MARRVRQLGGESLLGARARLGSLGLAVARRRSGHELVEQLARDARDTVHGTLESRRVCLRGLGEAADLAHVLKRSRADLVIARGWLEVVKGTDVSAHTAIL